MKLALVGMNAKTWPTVRAVVESPGVALTSATGLGELQSAVMQLAPSANILSEAAEVLSEKNVAAVLVADSDDAVLESAKQLAASGRPLLIVPQSGQGKSWIYEIALIYDETPIVLFPVRLAEYHSAVERAAGLIADSTLGKVLHVELERSLPTVSASRSAQTLTADEVEDALLFDLALLRKLFGPYRRVTALYSGADAARISLATVTLAGDGLPETVWIAKPSATKFDWKMSIRAERGTITLSGSDDPGQIELAVEGEQAGSSTETLTDTVGQKCVAAFETAVASKDCQQQWSGLIHDFDLLDGIHRSLRRRRTIDVHFEVASERNQFKSQMTAIGCGVLTFTLFGLVALLLAGRLLDPRAQVEVQAERMNAIFLADEFSPASAELSKVALERVRQISESAAGNSFPILIEQATGQGSDELNALRSEALVTELNRQNVDDASQRVSLGPIAGNGFQLTMKVIRVLLFLPLFLFLGAQALLWIARPARSSSTDE